MLVKPERLRGHLQDGGLRRMYLVYGDEPLQHSESADLIRMTANAAGHFERVVFEIDKGFEWHQVKVATDSLSLFAQSKLVELRFGAKKPDKAAAETLQTLAAVEDTTDVYMIMLGQLDPRAQRSVWFKAIDAAGVTIPARSLKTNELIAWLVKRAGGCGVELAQSGAELIAMRAEGNMLAAAQEIEKLVLSSQTKTVDVDSIMSIVTDNARYDIFQLVDTALAGHSGRAIRILRSLREEGLEAVIISWAMNRELRSLTRMAIDTARGKSIDQVLGQHRVWHSRAACVRSTLVRLSLSELKDLLRDSVRLDRIIKGSQTGNVWDELEILLLGIAANIHIARV